MPTPATPPEKVERVVKLAQSGMRPVDICRHLNGDVKLGRIYHIISAARAKGTPIDYFPSGPQPGDVKPSVRVQLRAEIVGPLVVAADRRGLNVHVLVQRLVEIVARQDLFDAVLDDRRTQ